MPKATIMARVYDTEDPARVRAAVLDLFPGAEFEDGPGILARTDDLSRFKELLWEQRISDAARGFLSSRVRGKAIRFHLGKQAAFVGKVSLTDEGGPLGAIEVIVEAQEPDALISDLTDVQGGGEG